MKILITGSHFTPAQAVIEELLKNNGVKIVYVGREYTREGDRSPSAESQILPRMGITFIPLITGRLQRSFTIYTIPSLLKIPIGFLQSLVILFKESPDVILSFGGYVAVPVVMAGWLLSKKIIIHEQTLVSGLANQISAVFANKIAVTFDNGHFPKEKTVLTGNPLREEIINPVKSITDDEINSFLKMASGSPVILITGGNQGSHVINKAIEGCLDELTKVAYVIHQTGDSKFQDFESLEGKKQTLKEPTRYLVREWFDARIMGYIFTKIDLAVSRAGANSLLEFAYHQIPSLVIPIPYLYKNEQMVNAKFFSERGNVKILPQNGLNSLTLLANIKTMVKDLARIKKSGKDLPSLTVPNASQRLALETIILAGSNSNG